MKHSVERLSAFVDGDLPERQAERVRAHVAECAKCRAEVAALESLRQNLASLPAPEPSGDAWLQLAQRLPAAPSRRRSWRRWVLAPAFAAVAAVALFVQLRARGPSDDVLLEQAESEFRGAEAQYQHALQKLEQVTAHAEKAWPAERQKEYASARAALEAATEQCRQVARSHPADPEAEEVLFAAYRKQIHFYEEQLLR